MANLICGPGTKASRPEDRNAEASIDSGCRPERGRASERNSCRPGHNLGTAPGLLASVVEFELNVHTGWRDESIGDGRGMFRGRNEGEA